jgi:hypothetical protein
MKTAEINHEGDEGHEEFARGRQRPLSHNRNLADIVRRFYSRLTD